MRTYSIAMVVGLGAVALALLLLRTAGGDAAAKPATQPASESRRSGKEGKPMLSKSGHDVTPLDKARINVLAKDLTPEERDILLGKGTERPFCGGLLDNKENGIYTCRLCGLPLFSSKAKFKSGTGWPSFFQSFDPAHVHETTDRSHGMVRTEITCGRCGSHLGHVFDDGPPPTGLRYCINGVSLKFVAA